MAATSAPFMPHASGSLPCPNGDGTSNFLDGDELFLECAR